jgi:hypothetical protein
MRQSWLPPACLTDVVPMSSIFDQLPSPLRLGCKTVPSRIAFGAHQTNFAVHYRFEARHSERNGKS